MAVGELVAMIYAGTAFLAVWRSQRELTWLVIGLGLISSALFATVRDGLDLVLVSGPISASFVVGSVIIGTLFWAQLGLPTRLAVLTGIGIKGWPGSLTPREADRRSKVSWFGATGVATLIIGAFQLWAYLKESSISVDPGLVLAVLGVVAGLILLGLAAFNAIRR